MNQIPLAWDICQNLHQFGRLRAIDVKGLPAITAVFAARNIPSVGLASGALLIQTFPRSGELAWLPARL
jgi:hypothetical protein